MYTDGKMLSVTTVVSEKGPMGGRQYFVLRQGCERIFGKW